MREKGGTEFVRELFAKNGDGDADAAKNAGGEGGADAQSVDEVVQTIAEDYHPRHCPDHRVPVAELEVVVVHAHAVRLHLFRVKLRHQNQAASRKKAIRRQRMYDKQIQKRLNSFNTIGNNGFMLLLTSAVFREAIFFTTRITT